MDLKELLISLSGLMSVSGFEYTGAGRLAELVSPYFNSYSHDNAGNFVFIKKCGLPKAKRLLIDTHYDEIGLMVKGITDEGFLRVCGIGGMDARVLAGARVLVYGKQTTEAVLCPKPAFMRENGSKLTSVSELLADTGYTKDELTQRVSVGDAVGFMPVYTELKNGYITGKGFDNKASAAAAVYAMTMLDMSKLGCDIYLSLSAKEEVGQKAASSAAFAIKPDAAVAIDVTFAVTPDSKDPSCVKCGNGTSVSISASLDRKFTDFVARTAAKRKLKCEVIVEAPRTGTHADELSIVNGGIPTVLLGIPLMHMHTAAETVRLSDIENTSKLICAIAEEKFAQRRAVK